MRFSSLFGTEITRYYHQQKEAGVSMEAALPLPPRSEALREELRESNAAIGADIPDDLGYLFLTFWVRIYGLVAMEIFGHLPIEKNLDELFWTELHAMAATMGVELPGPDELHVFD